MVPQRATIKDVAKQAGVSIKTVSRVINDEPYVRDATRQRVLQAIDALGYVVSQPARRLSSGHSYTIGLIFHNASWHYLQRVLRGVIETTRKQGGYSALLHPCDTNCRDDVQEILNLVNQSMVDGFIFTPPVDNDSELIDKLQQLNVPFIRLTPQDRKSPLPYVTATDLQGAFEMTNYLIGLGHHKIGYIHGPVEQRAAHDRFEGYKQALAKSNIEFDPNLVQQGNDLFDSGHQAASKLLELDHLPSAIFCNNDEMAAGAISAVSKKGLRVPGDISVAGFDDIPLSRQIWPPLTTVNQPIFEIAETATNHLIRMLSGEQVDHLYHELSTNLVIRESTAEFNNSDSKLQAKRGVMTMKDDNFKPIYQGIITGDAGTVKQEVQVAVDAGFSAEDILKQGLVPAMKEVGELFERGEYYVPEMLISARAMQAGLEILKPLLASAEVEPAGTVVLGTVQGDLHDIGKNLVGMMLEGAGFSLIDLGTDVSADKFVEVVRENKTDIIAMSALLTTTMPSMKTTIDALTEAGLRSQVKIMIGGAPVTEEYANNIGADGFAPDASRAASLAQTLLE